MENVRTGRGCDWVPKDFRKKRDREGACGFITIFVSRMPYKKCQNRGTRVGTGSGSDWVPREAFYKNRKTVEHRTLSKTS